MNVLFICKENVGRSQMAETLFHKITGLPAYSAATHVNVEGQPIQDRPLAAPVIRLMKKEGYDIGTNTAKQITKKMVSTADHIIVLHQPDLLPDYIANSPKTQYWYCEDPCGKNDHTFSSLIEELRTRIYTFAKKYKLI